MKKIAILGVGNLGASIAKGLIENQAYEYLYLSRRNHQGITHFKESKNVILAESNIVAVRESDIVIVAVQPRHFKGVLEEIKPVLRGEQLLISTVTGVSISEIEKILTFEQPIARAMPNTAISVGKSMTCFSFNKIGICKKDYAFDVFENLGKCMVIPEDKMQAATVICASGIAFWLRLIRATMQGAIQMGFESNDALEISLQTCLGAVSILEATGRHPEQEIDIVTTPGGCTIEGLNEMENGGLSSALIKGLLASYEKINQMKE